jgi:vacuolar-type H+-ATPase subunit I/STV1
MTQLTKAEQSKVDTLIRLAEKERKLWKKLDRLNFHRFDSNENENEYQKIEQQLEKVQDQFNQKFKSLPQHCARPVENATGFIWEDFQND